MTTSDPNATTGERGRHVRSATSPEREPHENKAPDDAAPEPAQDDRAAEATAAPGDAPQDPQQQPTVPGPGDGDQPQKADKRAWFRPGAATHPLGHHPAGNSLLMSSGLLTGLALAPMVFDQLDFDIATRAARTARSAAASWPGGGEPWFWPAWVALLAGAVALLLLAVALAGVRLPDLVVLVLGAVLAVTTARAAWATLAVVNARLWDLIPVALICLLAFGLAVSGAAHWRSPDGDSPGSGAGGAAGVAIAGVALALLLLAGGATVASVQAKGLGPGGPPQALAGLLSTRAADAAAVDDLAGPWVPQVAAAQVADDPAATAYSTVHRDWTARTPALLVRGDDVTGLDDSWWLTVAAQGFASEAEVQAWCTANALPGCTPVQVSG
ncbi:hypothetical protein [Blastococcus haudaquaticus]|uniref:Uncharacterized protein n=1 Tax=Blastococcus haudaquaticus TaxID=1938745 RepID=A0A286H741_9ACTN|nr:hypothetical protein [Blastococcus haudaquaticus]SOE03571.1 hypothetical protein SAMN06272739_4238 [Blastococcus haudaquaticus]